MNITSATFDGRPATIKADAAAQQLTVTLPAAASVGRHSLAFAWTGKINQSASGLFAIDYANADGSSSRMLATQFEAPDARRFAPMWDEPAFKAKFRLSAVAPGAPAGLLEHACDGDHEAGGRHAALQVRRDAADVELSAVPRHGGHGAQDADGGQDRDRHHQPQGRRRSG
ncbi:hypothetical protein QP185_00125 [Sphingomonas aerolata]|uniref:hypothetical protein n=1 Tax=Sphingomonas aerolata TaxID=185951 RepID=UPI002FE2DEE4